MMVIEKGTTCAFLLLVIILLHTRRDTPC